MRNSPIIRGLKTSAALLPLLLTGCGWYMDMSNSIGSHMPTYDDWFGDDKPKNNAPGYSQYNPDPYSYGMPAPSQGAQMQQPAPPRGAAMPQGYYQTERVQAGSQQPIYGTPQDPRTLPAPAGSGMENPTMAPGPAPDEGLRQLQMQQQMQMQPNQMQMHQPTPYGGQPQPFMPPSVPFTQPDLTAPVEEQSGSIEKTLPSDLPATQVVQQAPTKKERGTFAFVDDISEVIGGWFGDSEAQKKPYPNLAAVPQAEDYKSQHAMMQQSEKELLADRAVAESKQQEITDWSQLAESASPAAAPLVKPLASPTADQPLQTIAPAPVAEVPAPMGLPQAQNEMMAPPPLVAPVAAPTPAPQPHDEYAILEQRLNAESKPTVPQEKSWYSNWFGLGGEDEQKPVANLTQPQPMPETMPAYEPAPQVQEQPMAEPQPQPMPEPKRVVNPVPQSEQTVVYRNEQVAPATPQMQPQTFVAPPPPIAVQAEPAPAPAVLAPQIYVPQPAAIETKPEYLREPDVASEQGFLPASRYAARRAAER